MSPSLALLAERDAALRQLMGRVLGEAGYDVRACASGVQLKGLLHSTPLGTADCALLVLQAELAADCSKELWDVIRLRSSARLSRVHVVFTCEFGALALVPSIGDYHFAGLFEKPFDFDELESVARGCRAHFRQGQSEPA
jgi:DNA-binding response OmpR family regulator